MFSHLRVEKLTGDEAESLLSRYGKPLVARSDVIGLENLYTELSAQVQWANQDEMSSLRMRMTNGLRALVRSSGANVRRGVFNHVYNPKYFGK